KPFGINQTIFHSDGGGQYYDKGFRAELLNSGIISSMAENVYENPHAERINRTVKSNYIKHYDPSNYQELCQCLKKAVDMYNNDRPHQSLNRLTPKAFRQLHELNPQNQCLSTKEKRSKKEKIIITSNNIVKPSKVVNTN
ncbi:MAG: integrase core domain-containing protein, partial [Bacteroidetes bacterium]|nr:integrase core domain-containing protein [Bacteroidota bacterium]